MISFESFTMEDGSPIYMQIIRYIKRGIIAGTIRDRDELPSRRVLSSLLGVNPNTIQKAYRMLEEEEIIESHSGAKSYITAGETQISRIRSQLVESDVKTLIKAMQQMGVSREDTIRLVEKIWD
ncbi:GntR family transcriptional regulator [Bacilliculturomica massiliensis]|uniref:GntR family transcriptional regulator n=1 Tax=Bacilliculturomica massiliensis TaxID=1917867 RepID=UPI0010323D11|nr:GntR family transcriptional regulator [Bacilliculturomica massiliensis]